MPAIGSRTALARTRVIRLVGLSVALLFLVSVGTAYATPVAARDWTPQIQATRRAQIYWEGIMRSADRELRSLKKSRKQTQRKLKQVKASRARAASRRALALRKYKAARAEARKARRQLRAATTRAPVSEPAPLALPTVVILAALPYFQLQPEQATSSDGAAEPEAAEPTTTAGPAVDARAVKKLERQSKKAKRAYKKAKRKTRRSARNVRATKQRLTAIQAATRGATTRRESAERSLGAWIVAMSRYGRIRASRKSNLRPGINSSFAWPVRGSISQYYHRGHDGIDIVRYSGAAVRSMAYGVVTFAGWNPWDQHRRAFMVVITHAGGYETLYGHLQPRRIVRVGEEIRKGQVIGYMGNTGNSTGPHLHLELRRGRTTLNPLGVL